MKKLKVLASCLLMSTFGFATASQAFTSYLPPERISCQASNGKITCEGFDHTVFEVLQYSPHVPDSPVKAYHFVDGVAYNMTDSQSGIAFLYKDTRGKSVKITTTEGNAKPDLTNDRSAWTKIQEDLYICNAGYMSCPIVIDNLK